MKLKLVVASMSVLGLISCPAFAATQVKHKVHHKMMRHHMVEANDYKAMGSLPVVPVMQTCQADSFQQAVDFMDQNLGRAKPTQDCNKAIAFAGGINFGSNWGNRHTGFQSEDESRYGLNDAYVNVYGNVNEWTKAFMAISYNTVNTATMGQPQPPKTTGKLSFSYAGANTVDLEQGFITLGKFEVLPIFLQLGKQYVDFGRYQIHDISENLTTAMAQSLKTAVKLGFVTPMGLTGSAMAFNNPVHLTGDSHNKNNYTLSLGYNQPSDSLGFDVGANWMYDFTGVDVVANSSSILASGTEQHRVNGAAFYGDINSGPFNLNLRYVTAITRYDSADLKRQVGGTVGAKPWAASINAGYGFNAWGKNQNVYLGFQRSTESVYFLLPRARWQAGYDIAAWNNTKVGVQVNHDIDYNQTDGGTGQTTNTVNLRVGVLFG